LKGDTMSIITFLIGVVLGAVFKNLIIQGFNKLKVLVKKQLEKMVT